MKANSLAKLVSGPETVLSTTNQRVLLERRSLHGWGGGLATKKSIPKLALNRETVRTLVDTELARVIGFETNCTGVTQLASGCSSTFHADSLAQNLQAR